MHDAPDAGLPGGGEQRLRVPHRLGEREPLVVEPDPVRVVEDRRPRHRLDEGRPIGKAQRPNLDAGAEGMGPVRGVGERSHRMPGVQQAPGDVAPAVAEGPGDDMEFLPGHGDQFRTGADRQA